MEEFDFVTLVLTKGHFILCKPKILGSVYFMHAQFC